MKPAQWALTYDEMDDEVSQLRPWDRGISIYTGVGRRQDDESECERGALPFTSHKLESVWDNVTTRMR